MQHFSCVAPAAGKCGLRMHKITLCYAALGWFFPGTRGMVVAVPAKDRDKFHVATFCFAGLAGSATDEWKLCGMRKTLCLMRVGLQKV